MAVEIVLWRRDIGRSACLRWSIVQLLAIDLVVLRGSDLPLTVALQPGIGPDLALLRVGMHFVFADGVLAAVNDGHVFARRRRSEEAHPGIVDRAAARRV